MAIPCTGCFTVIASDKMALDKENFYYSHWESTAAAIVCMRELDFKDFWDFTDKIDQHYFLVAFAKYKGKKIALCDKHSTASFSTEPF